MNMLYNNINSDPNMNDSWLIWAASDLLKNDPQRKQQNLIKKTHKHMLYGILKSINTKDKLKRTETKTLCNICIKTIYYAKHEPMRLLSLYNANLVINKRACE